MAPHSQNPEVDKVAGELRASIRRAQVPRSHIPASRLAAEPEGAIKADLEVLRCTYDIAGAPFTSHRKFLGRVIISIKNIARELLLQLLARQSAYNGAAVRVIGHLTHKLGSLEAEHARMAQRLAALEARLGAAQTSGPFAGSPASNGPSSTVGRSPGKLDDRSDAAEKAGAQPRSGPRYDA